MSAERLTCPKCHTVTWTNNKHVARCRICGHMIEVPKDEK